MGRQEKEIFEWRMKRFLRSLLSAKTSVLMKTLLLCDAFARKCLQLRYHGQQSGTFDHLLLAKTLCQRLVSTLFGRYVDG